MAEQPTRKSLTLKRKMKIIDVAENRSRDRKDHMAKDLGIACSTFWTFLKNNTKIREQFLEGGNFSALRKSRKSPYEDVDKCTTEWFVACLRKKRSSIRTTYPGPGKEVRIETWPSRFSGIN